MIIFSEHEGGKSVEAGGLAAPLRQAVADLCHRTGREELSGFIL